MTDQNKPTTKVKVEPKLPTVHTKKSAPLNPIVPMELNNNNKIVEVDSPLVELIEEEIPTITTTAPPKITTPVLTKEEDISWVGEDEAISVLDNDPYTNPNVPIETPLYFREVPDATEEELKSAEPSMMTPVIESVPIEEVSVNEEFTSNNDENIEENLPVSEEISSTEIGTTEDTNISTVEDISSVEKEEEILSNVTEDKPEIPDEWESSVVHDVPEIDPEVKPGMENNSGPVFLEDDASIEDASLLNVLGMEVEEESISTINKSTDTETKPVVTDTVSEIVEDDRDQVTIFTKIHSPEVENMVPLNAEPLAAQFDITMIKDEDSAKLARMKKRALMDNDTFAKYVNRSVPFLSAEQSRSSEQFKNSKGPFGHNKVIDNKKYGDAFSGKANSKMTKPSTTMTGKQSYQTAMALICGVRKVPLYNSGFNVTIRPPLLNELHQYYVKCRSNESEFGRTFGYAAYIPADIELRRAGIDLFKNLILDSNLKDYETNFELALTPLDYDVCLWAMASLMFPEGTTTEFFCNAIVNEKLCGNVDSAKVDISKMRFNDYSKISDEAIKYVCASGKENTRTLEDIQYYKTELLPSSEELKLNDEWTIEVGVPSFQKMIDDGEAFVADMASKIQLNRGLDVVDFLKTKYFRIFSPWITRITYLNKETGSYLHFTDPVKLPEIIEALQLDEKNIPLSSKIEEFFNKKKVTHFGYLYTKCPKCNTVPDLAVNGVIPSDMQQNFFTLTMDRIS